jgi:hypothetical protein
LTIQDYSLHFVHNRVGQTSRGYVFLSRKIFTTTGKADAPHFRSAAAPAGLGRFFSFAEVSGLLLPFLFLFAEDFGDIAEHWGRRPTMP